MFLLTLFVFNLKFRAFVCSCCFFRVLSFFFFFALLNNCRTLLSCVFCFCFCFCLITTRKEKNIHATFNSFVRNSNYNLLLSIKTLLMIHR